MAGKERALVAGNGYGYITVLDLDPPAAWRWRGEPIRVLDLAP
ncbi:hypothetical protein ABZ845_12680 [Streptomyces sp. NPDC047022]